MDRKLNINQIGQRSPIQSPALENVMTTTKQIVNAAQQAKLESFTTKSAKIRYLDSAGMTRGQIAKTLGIRYQHVRNVLITPVKEPREK